jgi:hypothetical protein
MPASYTDDATTIGQRLATEITKTAAVQFPTLAERSIQTYRKIETGRNLHIDSKGRFYSQDGKPTDQETAIDRAMPAGQAYSHNEMENSLGLDR